MKLAVVVFVKTPGLSPIKTRLAKGIGKEAAETFFIESVQKTKSTLREFAATGDVDCYWAVAEEAGLKNELWQEFPRIRQVGGGLGNRMHGAYEYLRAENDFVMLLGADCPQIPLDYLVKAKAALFGGDYRHALGPTEDGGFYLFASGSEFSLKQWTRPEYSLDTTRRDFEEFMGLEKDETWVLPELFDIDEPADLERYRARI